MGFIFIPESLNFSAEALIICPGQWKGQRRSFHSPDSSSSESIFASPRSSSDLAGHRGCLRVAKRLGGWVGLLYKYKNKHSENLSQYQAAKEQRFDTDYFDLAASLITGLRLRALKSPAAQLRIVAKFKSGWVSPPKLTFSPARLGF